MRDPAQPSFALPTPQPRGGDESRLAVGSIGVLNVPSELIFDYSALVTAARKAACENEGLTAAGAAASSVLPVPERRSQEEGGQKPIAGPDRTKERADSIAFSN